MKSMLDKKNENRNRVGCLILPNQLSSLFLAENLLESICTQAELSIKDTSAIVLAMSEVVCNIIQYGYKSSEESEIVIDVSIADRILTILINDEGTAVPTKIVQRYRDCSIDLPSTNVPVEDLPDSGWGVNILLLAANDVRYTRTASGNQIELEFLID